MRIKIGDNNWIAFSQVRQNSQKQVCSYCHKNMGPKTVGLCIRKIGKFSSYNIWVHIKCIKPFLKDIREGLEKNKDEIMMKVI